MRRIALVHPEGNFSNNPNLKGLLCILAEQGYQVDYYAEHRAEIDQTPPSAGINVFLGKSQGVITYDAAFLLPSIERAPLAQSALEAIQHLPKPDLIIGIDRGIIEAAALARAWGIPVGLISYEIWFAVETSSAFKAPEIEACKDLLFAICQDAARSEQLCIENQIQSEKILHIPVAGRAVRNIERTSVIQSALGLEPNRKLVLYMGELSGAFAGIDEIIESTIQWPDSWALILHHRYGNSAAMPLLSKVLKSGKKNVFFSPFTTLPTEQMGQLLGSVDLGLAFYRPSPGHPTSDRNLRCIGMASGKIATYLQHGVPIVVNEIGEMAEHVRTYGLGGVVSHGREIPELLTKITTGAVRLSAERCHQFFAERLDLNRTITPFLDLLKSLN